MAKKILIINGHPDQESYNFALAASYRKGAESSGAEVRQLNLRDLDFSMNLKFGYRQRCDLEPDLLQAREAITWAEHLVWVFPVWWGSLPALMKGFVDRVFLPGFAFQKRENSLWWDKLLKGRSARVICTLDQPAWFYRWFNGRPTYHAMKKMTLHFSGIRPVRTTAIGPIRLSKDKYREKWLQRMERLGQKGI